MVDLSKMTKWDMGKLFDFSVLPKQSTEADIRRGCQIAKEYNCKAFCQVRLRLLRQLKRYV